MNRAERRALTRRYGPAVGDLEATRIEKERELEANAIALRRMVLANNAEPAAERLRIVDETIREVEADPKARLFVGPALVVLRALRDDLTRLVEAH